MSAHETQARLPLISIGIVTYSDRTIELVAQRSGRTVEEVRAYLGSDEQNDELLRAFCYFCGGGPIGKMFIGSKVLEK